MNRKANLPKQEHCANEMGTVKLQPNHTPGAMGAAAQPATGPKIGLALGGGFARAAAHVGVLKILESHQIPIGCVTGVSAGAVVAAAYASGATAAEIAITACSMRFRGDARTVARRHRPTDFRCC